MTRAASTVAKIEGHREKFLMLWSIFESVAIPAIIRGASIFVEWPRVYWKERRVAHFFSKYEFKFTEFDGCMYGLVAKHGPDQGKPIKKPWNIALNKSSISDYLNRKCD
eukprot:13557600-Heterocapsa_arctica.AAC.1